MAVNKTGQTILIDGLDQLVNVLTSPNVPGRNGEPSNIVDAIEDLGRGIWAGLMPKDDEGNRHNVIREHAEAIGGLAAVVSKGFDLIGGAGHFDDHSPAKMISNSLYAIANAIGDLATAVRENTEKRQS